MCVRGVWVQIYSWNFPLSLISDVEWSLRARKPSRIISDFLTFMVRLLSISDRGNCFGRAKSFASTHTLASRKNRWKFFLLGRMNGRMADGSLKIWITQFKVIVVFVLNHKHQQRRRLSQGWIFSFLCWCWETGTESGRIASHIELDSDASLTRISENVRLCSANNSDWWITSPAPLRSLQLCLGNHFGKHYF